MKKNEAAPKCHWQDVSWRRQTEGTLERTGWSRKPGLWGVSRADSRKGFLGSDQDFCPNPQCTGTLALPTHQILSQKTGPEFLSIYTLPGATEGLIPSCFLNSRPGTMQRKGKNLPLAEADFNCSTSISHLHGIRRCSKCSKSYTENNRRTQGRGVCTAQAGSKQQIISGQVSWCR